MSPMTTIGDRTTRHRFAEIPPLGGLATEKALDLLLTSRVPGMIYGVRESNKLAVLLCSLSRQEWDTALTSNLFHWHGYAVHYVPDKYLKIQGLGSAIKVNNWEPFLEGTPPELDAAEYLERCADTERDIYTRCGLPWHLAKMKWHSIAARSELFLIAEKFLEHYRVHQGLAAYYGPREEQAWQGIYDGPLWHYDIHAAYPYAVSQLRSFTGRMAPVSRILPRTYGFYFCHWDLRFRNHAYYPFPVRLKNANGTTEILVWPPTGQAWVSCFELEAYTKIYGWKGITLLRGYAVQHEDHDCKFQNDMRTIYAMRQERPSIFIKKFAASMYGKTIQQAGNSQVYNSFYAALVTGYTRAQLIPHLSENVISIQADSLITKAEIADIDVGPGMGQWDRSAWKHGVFVKTGIYELTGGVGKIQQLRGFQDLTVNCEGAYREALRFGHFDLHIVVKTRKGGTKRLCVRNSPCLTKRMGTGLLRNHFGKEALTYYPPARGSRSPSLPYTPRSKA